MEFCVSLKMYIFVCSFVCMHVCIYFCVYIHTLACVCICYMRNSRTRIHTRTPAYRNVSFVTVRIEQWFAIGPEDRGFNVQDRHMAIYGSLVRVAPSLVDRSLAMIDWALAMLHAFVVT